LAPILAADLCGPITPAMERSCASRGAGEPNWKSYGAVLGPVPGAGAGPALGDWLVTHDLKAIERFVAAERKAGEVYPPDEQVFEALRRTPFKRVRAVILGQDPYPRRGQAHGLAFSTADGSLPPSLRNILAELREDCGSGTFSPTGTMATARTGQTATLLPNGRVLIVGGADADDDTLATNVLASAELYDPATGSFSPAGSMATGRQYQSATLLPDGRVLIAGGADGLSGTPPLMVTTLALASAELYQP